MKFNVKKLLKSSLITLAALGMIGGTFNGSVNAKRRGFRTHRVYRHRKNVKRYRQSGIAKYAYEIKNRNQIRAFAINYGTSVRKALRKYGHHGRILVYNVDGLFYRLSTVKSMARVYHMSLLSYLQRYGNYGHLKGYDIGGFTNYYSKAGLRAAAREDHMSVSHFLTQYNNDDSDESDNDTGDVNDTTAPTQTESPEQEVADAKQEVLNDLNQDRASVGESALNEDPDLDNEAQQRSEELVSNFSHQNADGQYAYDEDSNVTAENIAEGSGESADTVADETNQSMFNGEQASGGIHYENIVNNNNVGVGVTVNNGTTYIAEDFN